MALLFSISYCMADPTYNHVFAFITEVATNELECHAFLCPKRKVAKVEFPSKYIL